MRPIERREFLRFIGGGAAVLFFSVCRSGIPIVPEESLEDRLKIRIITLRDYYRELGLEYPEHQSYLSAVPWEWDKRRLQLLEEGLSVLPKHFYQNGNTLGRMGFILSFNNSAGTVIDHPELRARHIELNHEEFTEPSIKEPVDILAHELSHLQVPVTLVPSGIILTDFLTGKPFEIQIKKSPWFLEVEDILGGEFSKIYSKPLARIQAEQTSVEGNIFMNRLLGKRIPDPELRERAYFYRTLAYGFENAVDPYEFIAVMASHYMHGKTYFQTRYSEIFPEATTLKLYDFCKVRIFRNQEYERFPLPSYLYLHYPQEL